MIRYVSDLQTSDKILVLVESTMQDEEPVAVIIDNFLPISDDEIVVGGYIEDTGDNYSEIYNLSDTIKVIY